MSARQAKHWIIPIIIVFVVLKLILTHGLSIIERELYYLIFYKQKN